MTDLRTHLLALIADGCTPVELAYHPDADPGDGSGWSLLVGDRHAYGSLDTLLPSPPPPETAHTAPAGGSSSLGDALTHATHGAPDEGTRTICGVTVADGVYAVALPMWTVAMVRAFATLPPPCPVCWSAGVGS
jgi:hypothetical protein